MFEVWFLVDIHVVAYGLVASFLFVALPLTVFFYFRERSLGINGNWEDSKILRSSFKRIIYGPIILIILTSLSYYPVFQSSALLHDYFSKPSSLSANVINKVDYRKNHRCLILKTESKFIGSRICWVNKLLWKEIVPPEKITLLGSKSVFGFKIDSIKQI